jgi:hypothetical protein
MSIAKRLVADAVLGLSATLMPPATSSPSNQSAWPHGLEGAWWVTVTLENCTTGVPYGLPFSSMLTFARGGTVTETTSNPGFQHGQRSVGLGTWSQGSDGTYTASDVAFILFSGGPFVQGTQKLVHSITLSSDGSSWTDSATIEFLRHYWCSRDVRLRYRNCNPPVRAPGQMRRRLS